MTENLPYYLGFSHCLGIGPIRFNTLVAYYGSVQAAYNGDKETIQYLIGHIIGEQFVEFRNRFDPFKKEAALKAKHITVIAREDEAFPAPLKEISDSPICLYVKKNWVNSSAVLPVIWLLSFSY